VTDLSPCPFCGSRNVEPLAAMGEWWVRCRCCTACGGTSSSSAAHAAEAWNGRAMPLALADLLSKEGCSCECEHHPEEHDDDCARCLACRVEEAMQ
jgi:hypothetical protein